MSDTVLAWHFVGKTLRDGRPVPADGKWLTHDGPLIICESGLHASERLIDALKYAPGSTICRVECAKIGESHDDKIVCAERRILWRVDADDLLWDFARWAAWQQLDKWAAPDVVRQFLATGDPALRAASWAAPWAASWAARAAAGGVEAGGVEAAQNEQLITMVEAANRGDYVKWTA